MHNLRDLVEEVSEVGLQHICVIRVLVDLADHEYGVDLLTGYHDLKVALA